MVYLRLTKEFVPPPCFLFQQQIWPAQQCVRNFFYIWEGKMSHVLERRRSHSSGEARCAVVQQPGHACSWRSKEGLVYFWHCAFSHKRNAFKKHIPPPPLSLFVCFIFLYSFPLSSIFFFLLELLNNSLVLLDSSSSFMLHSSFSDCTEECLATRKLCFYLNWVRNENKFLLWSRWVRSSRISSSLSSSCGAKASWILLKCRIRTEENKFLQHLSRKISTEGNLWKTRACVIVYTITLRNFVVSTRSVW